MTPGPQAQDNSPARVDPIRAGLLCRCPHCGRGRLFDGFLKVVENCETCGFDYRGLNTGDGPTVFVMQIAGGIVVFSALGVELAYSPPMWVHLVLWLPLVAVLSLGLMRPAKGLMIGLQVRNRAAEVRNDEF